MNTESTIAELEAELEKLETLAENCERQILLIKEAQVALSTTQSRVTSLLDKDSIAFRIFDRMTRERTQWWENTMSGYVSRKDCSHIKSWIQILDATINELEPEFLREEKREKKQYFIQDGDEYRAKKTIFKLMKRAEKELVIVDPYLDDTIFDYIESLHSSIGVRMLTESKKAIFPQLLKAFVVKRINVEARECSACHDRFLIIDQNQIWHLGASINHAGKKAFMINKVSEQNEKDDFLKNYQRWWSCGTPIIY
jgi:hypothetical protein